MNKCETCGEERECSQCHGVMAHVHFTDNIEPPAWFHTKPGTKAIVEQKQKAPDA